MFSFAWPWMILLLPLPLLVRLLFSAPSSSRQTTSIRHPYIQRLIDAYQQPGKQQTRGFSIRYMLLILLWCMLVASLMRPQLVDKFTQVKSLGRDLLLAVDLSGSMKALDFATDQQPFFNRLDVTKEVVGNFVKKRSGDRVGLILFGDTAYLHVPLTLDTVAVSDMLNNTKIGMAGEHTAIGDAIGLAVKHLRTRPKESRVVIILTDGSNTAGVIPPLEAAKLAAQYDIRIYTVGVGSNDLVPFPDKYHRIARARVKLDDTLLKAIADMTGGQYFNARDKQALTRIYTQIDQLEKTEGKSQEFFIRNPLYRIPLGIALALLVLLILPVRRRYV